jgi:hypothetical protein
VSGNVRQANRARADHQLCRLHLKSIPYLVNKRGRNVAHDKAWLRQWGSFLMGVFIGLLIITPVLAA